VDRLKFLLPIGAGGLIAGLPVFFITCDYFSVDKTKFVTTSFIAIWIVMGAIGALGRRIAIFNSPLVLLSSVGFVSLYYVDWAMWPKGTELDELMWAYSVAGAIVPFVFGAMFDRRDLRIFFVVVMLWGILLAGLVLIDFTASWESRYMNSRFTVGEALNPISQSLIIGFAVLALYAQALSKHRYYLFVTIFVLLFAMLLGGSRGPAVALMAALILMTFFIGWSPRKTFIILMLILGVIGVNMFLPDLVFERYFSTEHWLETQTGEGVPLRIETVGIAIDQWLEHPIFGSGTSGNQIIFYSHNLFSQILMEMGVVGLGLFLCILVPVVVKFFKILICKKPDDWEVVGFFGFLIYGLIEVQVSGTFMSQNFLWLAIGVLAAWPRIARRQYFIHR